MTSLVDHCDTVEEVPLGSLLYMCHGDHDEQVYEVVGYNSHSAGHGEHWEVRSAAHGRQYLCLSSFNSYYKWTFELKEVLRKGFASWIKEKEL